MSHLFHDFTRSKFVRDTAVLQIGRIGAMLLGMVSLWLTVRLMGFERYGVWKLTLALVALWQTLDISGVGQITSTRLAIAVGRRDESELRDLLAFYVKVVLAWSLLSAVVLFAAGPWASARLYDGDVRVGALAAWFSLTLAADALYAMVVVSLQSRRLMRQLAVLHNLNQVVLFVCVVAAMLARATPESMVVARLVYSYGTMLLAFVVYTRLRFEAGLRFPALTDVFRHAGAVSVRPYWRSGVAMALDKNIGNLFTQGPVSLVGMLAGETAAGYLGTGIDIISRSSLLTGPVLENVQAVVPQAVGRRDFAALRRNFRRVLAIMAAAALLFYGALALLAPVAVPLLFGPEAEPAAPVVAILALYGGLAAVGGLFGPVYRAFDHVRGALIIKLVVMALGLPLGVLLVGQAGAVGGAWLINLLFLVSIALTAAMLLPVLAGRMRNTMQEGS